MIKDYANGSWDPDEIRMPMKGKAEVECTDSESSKDSSNSQPSSDIEAIAQEQIVLTCERINTSDNRWCINVSNGKVHRGKFGDPDVTACNNPIGERIKLISENEVDEMKDDLCLTCFGRTLPKQREMLRRMSEPLIENLVPGTCK
jgi:hypothetical protein